MRSLLIAAVASLAVGTASAEAMPSEAASGIGAAPQVTLVAEGCGPGFRRGFLGRCVPFRGGFDRPVVAGPRCFIRDTGFGPRRVCRY